VLAILAKIGRALGNSISEGLHFQPLVAPEIDGAFCSAESPINQRFFGS
jgi:hypothetical protein